MIKKDFLKSSILYTVSSALSNAASFLLLPFYTNTNLLSQSDFGALTLYIAFSLAIQIIAGLSLDFYVSVSYHELKHDPQQLKEKLASLNGYMILTGVIVTLGFVVSGNFVVTHFIPNSNSSSLRYIIMAVITGVFGAYFKFYSSLLVNKEKPWVYFWTNILNLVTTFIFSLVILKKFPLTLEGPLWGRLLSNLSVFIWAFADVTFAYGIIFTSKFLKPVFKFCAPLVLTAVFQWALGSSPNYIIKSLLFNKAVAIFDLAVKFTILITFSLDGLSAAMMPRVFGLLKQEQNPYTQREINKYYSSFNLLALLIIALNIFVLPIAVPFFISDEKYLIAFSYFGIISIGLVTRSIQNLYIFPMYFFKQTTKLLWVTGISAVLQIFITYLMVRQFNLYGATFALNIIKLVQLLLFAWLCKSLLTPGVNMQKMVLLPLVSMIVISTGELFIKGYNIQMHFIHLIELLFIFLFCYYIYKAELWELVKWLKKRIWSYYSTK